jgi:hypothetical protein
MANVWMTKNGEDQLVNEAVVADHEGLGWARKKIEIAADGQSLAIPAGSEINYQVGAESLSLLQAVHYRTVPAAASAVAIHAAMNLAVAAQAIATGITQPDVPRTLTVKGNVSGITGNVAISGRNVHGQAISDTIALNGTTEVAGAKAFETVDGIDLPAETHTSTAQVETATAAGTITGSGNASVVVTAAGMTGSPKTKVVAVLENDTAAAWAAKVRAALTADADIAALFTVGGSGASIILTRKTPAANDTTLNIALDNGTCTGITTAASSANTTAGVGYDTVSIGRANSFGMPNPVDFAALLLVKLFDGAADDGALSVDSDEVEKNLYAVDGTPDGEKAIDLYFLQ